MPLWRGRVSEGGWGGGRKVEIGLGVWMDGMIRTYVAAILAYMAERDMVTGGAWEEGHVERTVGARVLLDGWDEWLSIG